MQVSQVIPNGKAIMEDHQEDQMIIARAIAEFFPYCKIRVKPPFLAYETSMLGGFCLGTLNLSGEFLRSLWEATAENGEPVADGTAYLWENGSTIVVSTGMI